MISEAKYFNLGTVKKALERITTLISCATNSLHWHWHDHTKCDDKHCLLLTVVNLQVEKWHMMTHASF